MLHHLSTVAIQLISETECRNETKAMLSNVNRPSAILVAVHTVGMRHASLGLIVLNGEVVERAGGCAHAWSGGFGLDLGRLFGHDRHLLVTG